MFADRLYVHDEAFLSSNAPLRTRSYIGMHPSAPDASASRKQFHHLCKET